MPGTSDPYASFRLNLDQQRKRAKDLLRAVRAGDAAARRRLADVVALPVPDAVTIKLADAQFAIAREPSVAQAIDRDALPAQNECARSEHPRPRKGLRPRPRSIRTSGSIVLFQPGAGAGT